MVKHASAHEGAMLTNMTDIEIAEGIYHGQVLEQHLSHQHTFAAAHADAGPSRDNDAAWTRYLDRHWRQLGPRIQRGMAGRPPSRRWGVRVARRQHLRGILERGRDARRWHVVARRRALLPGKPPRLRGAASVATASHLPTTPPKSMAIIISDFGRPKPRDAGAAPPGAAPPAPPSPASPPPPR